MTTRTDIEALLADASAGRINDALHARAIELLRRVIAEPQPTASTHTIDVAAIKADIEKLQTDADQL